MKRAPQTTWESVYGAQAWSHRLCKRWQRRAARLRIGQLGELPSLPSTPLFVCTSKKKEPSCWRAAGLWRVSQTSSDVDLDRSQECELEKFDQRRTPAQKLTLDDVARIQRVLPGTMRTLL